MAFATTTALARSLKEAVGLGLSSFMNKSRKSNFSDRESGEYTGVHPTEWRGVPAPMGSPIGSNAKYLQMDGSLDFFI
jgi:hypothetical protein